MNFLLRFFGSTAFTGFFPIAPATVSSFLLSLIFWFWAPGVGALWIFTAVAIVLSVPLAYFMEGQLGKDPGPCTVDEVAGLSLALALFMRPLDGPGTWKLLLAAFFLFRFFDIAKVWPGRRLERLPGGWGIVADDLMAGVYTFVGLKLLALWFL